MLKRIKKTVLEIIIFIVCGFHLLYGQNQDLVAYWDFDQIENRKIFDKQSGIQDTITGNFRALRGIKGQALVLDGYTTCISRPASVVPKLGGEFTIEAWIVIGAYPWNWAPIVAQENTISLNSNKDAFCWPADIEINSPRSGFFFGISPEGYLGAHVSNRGWQICLSKEKIPLYQWTHVATVFENRKSIRLFINGKEAGSMKFNSDFHPAEEEDLRIGMPHQKIEPSHPVRAFATLPSWYALDGMLDELRIYNQALNSERIHSKFSTYDPPEKSDLPLRIMPSGPPGKGVFGASYMNLKYYPEWDALWPVSSDPDIVVQFDDSPIRVVFWRGTRYSPAWVMENQMWMADQGAENFNMQDGCIEHMLDPRCRFSHVRIIENNPARIVIHWRNAPTSANGNFSQVDWITNWEDWIDEYYTFYPDGIGIRKVIQHTKGHYIWPEEVIALCHPGQRPEDVVDLSAMTLSNLKGGTHTYTWAEKTPDITADGKYLHFGNEPEERPVIMRVNLKSENKPFQIFETTNRFRIFAHEHRKGISHFPWWNHWPVAQIPSDGRYCQADDRASHFSLAWGGPPPHKGEDNTFWWAWMYGTTQKAASSLVPLARSWLLPPTLRITEGTAEGKYDLTQRCYVISGLENQEGVTFRLEGNADSPIFNPAFVLENWGNRESVLEMNGQVIQSGKNFRQGYIRRVNRYDLVVWTKLQVEDKVTFSLKKK